MVEIVAHRGAPSEHPENSLAGFQKAYDLGVHVIEFDVQMTKDNQIIVFHDRNTQRMTGQHKVIEKSTWNDLSSLSLLFQGQPTQEKIPRLQDVLFLFRNKKNVKFIVDCKTEAQYKIWRGIPYRIYQMISSFDMQDRVMYAAGTPWTLAQFRMISKGKAKTVLNIPSRTSGWIKVLQAVNTSKYVMSTNFADDYSFPLDCPIPDHLYTEIKKRGGMINVYSLHCDHDEESHVDEHTVALLSKCVDRIMTDDIRKTLEIFALANV